ncbi:SulP family inorganic anion transporter [Butyrivibrio sp. AE2032]|uniref:SulP family inorganic anion transporter n=1 Tax=Butyrivibrio sp. AE2032 TaxID=1458463 RepID=UPI000553B7D7|nr:SulP family inorganic anion transporter [Butyrivibrio sp. AE2032]
MKEFKPKLFSVMKNYSGSQLVKDIVAGIIVAIIALPLSIALAIASGVGPEAGIYTAIVAGFIVSFLGGSRVQIAGPTAAFATIVAGIVMKDGTEGLIIATIMAGIILIIMGFCRFGSLLKYIPDPITTGFTAGIAVTLFIGQIKDFTGISYMNGEKPIETSEKIMALINNAVTINWQAVMIGAIALAILIVWPMIFKKIPGSFVAVIVTAAIVEIFHLDVNTIGKSFQDIQAGLPPISINLSMFSFEAVKGQLSNAVTIAFLAGVESLLSAVVADSMIGSKHRPNMELVAQGVGNIASACLGGIPATGAIARTAANIKNGGRTPIAGMVHSVTLLIVVVFLMPYAKLIPMPCIAAILFQVAYNMSGWRRFVKLIKSSPKSDITVLVITFALTVIFDLVVAIEVGVLLAAVLFMHRMSEVTQVEGWKDFDPENDPDSMDLRVLPEHTIVYEISGPMFFASAGKILQISPKEDTKALVLRMRSVSTIDATAMRNLELLYDDCKARGVQLIMSHVNEQPMKVICKAGFDKKLGSDNFCAHIDDALARAQAIVKG